MACTDAQVVRLRAQPVVPNRSPNGADLVDGFTVRPSCVCVVGGHQRVDKAARQRVGRVGAHQHAATRRASGRARRSAPARHCGPARDHPPPCGTTGSAGHSPNSTPSGRTTPSCSASQASLRVHQSSNASVNASAVANLRPSKTNKSRGAASSKSARSCTAATPDRRHRRGLGRPTPPRPRGLTLMARTRRTRHRHTQRRRQPVR